MFEVFRKEVEWAGRKLVLETGKIARQADGAVMATYGGTTVPVQGVTIHLSDTPLSIERPMPGVGEHSAEVLREWLGFESGQVAALQASGAL